MTVEINYRVEGKSCVDCGKSCAECGKCYVECGTRCVECGESCVECRLAVVDGEVIDSPDVRLTFEKFADPATKTKSMDGPAMEFYPGVEKWALPS